MVERAGELVVQACIFLRERIKDCWDEAVPLMEANHRLAGLADHPRRFAPARALFETLEDRGALRLFTARQAGKLVGYAVFLVNPPLNHPDDVFAICHVAYMVPELHGFASGRFMLWQDAELARENVSKIIRSSTERFPVDKTYEHMGYSKGETLWAKDVNNG